MVDKRCAMYAETTWQSYSHSINVTRTLITVIAI